MKQIATLGFLLLFGLVAYRGSAQSNVAGFWLGVTYPDDPTQAIYNYSLNLTQSGANLTGTAQTANPNVPFSGNVLIKGQVTGTSVAFKESDQNGSIAVQGVCSWQATLTYNPTDESLTGPYTTILNNPTCTKSLSGKMELYRVVLKSGNTFCKGSPINLLVTGKNIRWYSSAQKTTLLATGNSYSPQISQTTTFYITQTLYQNESPAIPITVQVTTPAIQAVSNNSGCDKANGSIAITATGSTGWQYSLNGGPYQPSNIFSSLVPGSYTVVAKDTLGCQASQVVTITADGGPTITGLQSTPPHCETANGQVTVVATGGKQPLTYSINYGVTFQTSAVFTNLPGGNYTLRARDANGCEVNRALNIPSFTPMTLQLVPPTSTSCGQANGAVTFGATGGKQPIRYSVDNQLFQASGTFTGLAGGSYTLTARDSSGCIVTETVQVGTSSGPPSVRLGLSPEGCGLANGSITIYAPSSPASGQLQYALNGQPFQSAPFFARLGVGSYTLTIQDSQACTATQVIQLPSDCPNRVYLPAAFSPNQDQQNEALHIRFPFPSLTIARFTVYDRWGVVIYNRANFALASGEILWDGQANGQTAPMGVYVYRLDCLFPDGTQTTYHNSVVLLK